MNEEKIELVFIMDSLLKEIELGDGKFIDPNTAQKLGKGLGASYMLTGSFLIMGETMRIDARLVDVGTAEIIMAQEITGNNSEFFLLEKELANLIIARLGNTNTRLFPNNLEKNVNIKSVNEFSKIIDQYDKGDIQEADKMLNQLLSEDESFKDIISNISLMKEKID